MDGHTREGSGAQLHTIASERFEEGNFVGEGRNAKVYQAYDVELERLVALKITHDDTIIDDLGADRLGELGIDQGLRELVENFDRGVQAEYTLLREARLAAMVEHPGVISVLELGRFEDGPVAMVMPFLGGERIRHTQPWQTVLESVLQLAGGLAALHYAGIVHRDLKPDNILYDQLNRPCIADLGLACRLDDEEALKHFAGTSKWMAPETIGQGGSGVQNDIFAFCMIAFEMFYGHPPFADQNAKTIGLVSAITRDDDMPEQLRAVLIKGLAPDPASRWTSMEELIVALTQAQSPKPAPAPKHPLFKRGWWAIAATTGVAAGLGVGMVLTVPEARADACDEVAHELGDFWDRDVQAELRVQLGTRRAGDDLESIASRWLAVRAQECEAAKRDDRPPLASPCTTSVRDHLNATVTTLRTPSKSKGVNFARVIAELPQPEYCLDHPNDGEYGNVGLLQLQRLDLDVGLLLASGELELAEERQASYMAAARTLTAEYDIARAIHWRGELHRLRGELDEAEADFRRAYAEAQALRAVDLGGETMIKLVAVAGARGEMTQVDSWAFVARATFEGRRPDKVAELLEVQGLALVEGDPVERTRGLGLLRDALGLREAEYSRYGGTRERVGWSMEALARGLLAVERGDEALEVVQESLAIHELEFGGLTTRAHDLRRLVFVAQTETGRFDDAFRTGEALLYKHEDAQDWPVFVAEALWLGAVYSEAAKPSYAIEVLDRTRQVTAAHGLDDLTREVEARLHELAPDAVSLPRYQGK